MQFRILKTLVPVLALAVASQSFGTVLTFDNLQGTNGQTFLFNSEQGYTVSTLVGNWFVGKFYGDPVPDLFMGPNYGTSTSSLLITGPGVFNLQSADISSNNGSSTITYAGYLNNSLVFSDVHGLGSQGFTTVNSLNQASINALVITISASGTSANIDNINVTPEPATMAILGAGALALIRRRRKA